MKIRQIYFTFGGGIIQDLGNQARNLCLLKKNDKNEEFYEVYFEIPGVKNDKDNLKIKIIRDENK